MTGGGMSVSAPGGVEFEAKITPIVIISCIMAATGGLMFGYDVGISGTNLYHLHARVHIYMAERSLHAVVFDHVCLRVPPLTLD
jgi:hypothetical protein